MALEQEHHVAFGRWIEIGGDPARKKYGKVGWNLCDYQKAVRYQLQQVQGNAVGKAVLDELCKKVIILPQQKVGAYNATARPINGHYCDGHLPQVSYGADAAAIPKGLRFRTTFEGKLYDYTGAGGGSRSEIQYTPGRFVKGSALNPENKALFGPDEVLLHELVHAARQNKGLIDFRPVAMWLEDYKDKEEFLAVLITNMYRSVRGAKSEDLRWGYDFKFPRRKPASEVTMNDMRWRKHDSATFSSRYDTMIYLLIGEMPTLFKQLARIKCDFNPIAFNLEYGLSADAEAQAQMNRAAHPGG